MNTIKFSFAKLWQRVIIFGFTGFASVFVAYYKTNPDFNAAFSYATTALVASAIAGAGYDNIKYRDSKDAAAASSSPGK